MTQTSLNNVSIRLLSGGHSFSLAELKAAVEASKGGVEVVVLTSKTTLVPAEFFDSSYAAVYLNEVGLAPAVGECVVWSKPVGGIVAVMAINKQCYDALHGVDVEYTTPLLAECSVEKGSVLHLEGGLLYVRIYDGGMRFAEVVECTNDADVLYYLSKTDEVYNIYNTLARAYGDTARLQRLCKRLFKELICE